MLELEYGYHGARSEVAGVSNGRQGLLDRQGEV